MHLISNTCILIVQKSFYEPQNLYLDLFDYVNVKKSQNLSMHLSWFFLLLLFCLVLTVHNMHALKGPTLKNVNVHQVFSSLDLDFTSIYVFLCLSVHEEYVVSVLHFGTFFSGFILESSTVNCLFPSLLTLSGGLLWRTEGLSCLWPELYLPSDLSV